MNVTKKDIVDGLKNLFPVENPTMLVHSSLKSFGTVDGGADTVIDALLEVAGMGTVVVPTLTFGSVDESAPFFDVRNTRSDTGYITEVFRKLPDSRRSRHVTSSAAANGPQAEYMTSGHMSTPGNETSPYWRIMDFDGYVLFLGAKFGSNTLFHCAEEAVNPHYMRYKTIENARIIDQNNNEFIHNFIRYNCGQTGINRYLMNMEPVFRDRGVIKDMQIGNSHVMLIRAIDNFEISCEILINNPDYILQKRV
ncbi:MAG: AAC(3) family N-acetyltransferase [Oscillospiraceae bacterium]|nr:AAC(3) family N-acetyltransferase [Oscillospiraceae bacterium]